MFFRKKADDAPPFLNELEKKIYLQKKREMEMQNRAEMKFALKVTGATSTVAAGIGMGFDVMLTGGLGTATVVFTSGMITMCSSFLFVEKNFHAKQAANLVYDARAEAFNMAAEERRQICQPPPVKPSNAALLKLAFTPQEKPEENVEKKPDPSPSKVKKNVL